MKLTLLTTAVTAALLSVSSVSASTVITQATAIVTDYENGVPTTTADADGALGGTSNASVNPSFSGEATQNADGTSVLEGEGFLADGRGHAMYLDAAQTISVTNNSGAAQNYTFDYALLNMSAYINGDFGGASNTGNPFDPNDALSEGVGDSVGLKFDYNVFLDTGAGVNTIFSASITAFGGAGSYQLDGVSGFNGTLTALNCGQYGCSGVGLAIDDLVGSLNLGSIADGASFTVFTQLTATARANGFENELSFVLGDPTGVNALNAGVVTGGAAPAVPLPAAAWMLMAGLGGLGAMRKLRK
jgi:hypothetical protein